MSNSSIDTHSNKHALVATSPRASDANSAVREWAKWLQACIRLNDLGVFICSTHIHTNKIFNIVMN